MLHALVVSLAIGVPAFTASVPEDRVMDSLETVLVPWFQQSRVRGSFRGVDDVRIEYSVFPASHEKGALVVLNGRGGSMIQDVELLHDLAGMGWSLYTLDHRGQGWSDRLLENRFKGHVEHFQDYVDDLQTFIHDVVRPHEHDKVVVMAMSMGGGITTVWAEQHPDGADGLILVVPMHLPYYAQFPEEVAAGIGAAADVAGKDDDYAIGQHDPSPDDDTYDSRGSQSEARWKMWRRLQDLFPETTLGGVTFRWAWETLRATKRSRVEAARLTTPTLLLQAGMDTTVNNKGSDAVCQRAPRCRKIRYANAEHGVFHTVDDVRNQVLGDMQAFLDDVPARQGCASASPGVLWPLALLGVALRRRRLRS